MKYTTRENGARKKLQKLSQEQTTILEQNFENQHTLKPERKYKLAIKLGLEPGQIATWFRNRKARWKKRKTEEYYSSLQSEISLLENEVLKLKEQLSEAEKEIQRLQERADRVPNNNSSILQSQSMEAMDPPFLGQFRVDGYDDVFHDPFHLWHGIY